MVWRSNSSKSYISLPFRVSELYMIIFCPFFSVRGSVLLFLTVFASKTSITYLRSVKDFMSWGRWFALSKLCPFHPIHRGDCKVFQLIWPTWCRILSPQPQSLTPRKRSDKNPGRPPTCRVNLRTKNYNMQHTHVRSLTCST